MKELAAAVVEATDIVRLCGQQGLLMDKLLGPKDHRFDPVTAR